MRILVVQTSFLGDVILSTPVIAALAAQYPGAEIYFMATPAGSELVRRDPLIKGVIPFDKNGTDKGVFGLIRKIREVRQYNFTHAYALQRRARTSLLIRLALIPNRIGSVGASLSFLYTVLRPRDKSRHDVERNLMLVCDDPTATDVSADLRLFAAPDSEVSAELREIGQRTPFVLVPGSAWATKRWDPEGYRELARSLVKENHAVVLIGTESERDLCNNIAGDLPVYNLAGKTTLGELVWMIKQAKAVICNDSMAMHVASAVKTPTVAIFCATSPSFGFGPWRNRHVIVERDDLDCKPCSRHGTQSCPMGHFKCSHELKGEKVVMALKSLVSV